MLVLTRKIGQKLIVGDAVITIVKIKGLKSVRIGIDAPEQIKIMRGEVLKRDQDNAAQDHS